MEKNYLNALAVIAGIFYMPLSAQVLNMKEVNTNGNIYPINILPDDKAISYPNIDINSTLTISVNKDKIKHEAINFIGNASEFPENRMKMMANVLVQREKIMADIKFEPRANLADRQAAIKEFSDIVEPLISFIDDSLPIDNPFRIKAVYIFSPDGDANGDPTIEYSEILDAVKTELDSIDNLYKKSIADNKVYFRLGAFLNTTPVHLEGFDAIKLGDYYVVPRFVTSISDSEQQRFNQDKQIASTASNLTAGDLKNKLLAGVDSLLKHIQDSCKLLIYIPDSILKSQLDNLADIKDTILKIDNYVIQLKENITSFSLEAKNTINPDYFQNIINEVSQLYQGIAILQNRVQPILIYLNNYSFTQAQATVIEKFLRSYNFGKEMISRQVNNIQQFFNIQKVNVTGTQVIQESLLKLGNDVKKIPLDNIPESTTIDLRYTGHRVEGDRLYIKAVLGKTPLNSDSATEKTIEYLPIGLYQIELHNSIEAVLLFVCNTSAHLAGGSEFQIDPSYSVLFKWGSRNWTAYNEYLECGVGVNIATLDFKNDNMPEIGIGFVASAFKDYLQIGYGRNMEADQWYWFFGLRLPLLGFNF